MGIGRRLYASDRRLAIRTIERRVPGSPGARVAERTIRRSLAEDPLVEVSKLTRKGREDYLLVESRGNSESRPAAEPRLGRRTALTFPLLPPPQKN